MFGAVCFNLLPVAALPNVEFPTICGVGSAPGREPHRDGLDRGDAARRPVQRYSGARLDDLDQRARHDVDHAPVRPERRHRCRSGLRRAGDPGRERPSSQESSEPADLQGGQSGRCADSHLRGSFRRLSDPGARSIRQHPRRPVALASERRRPGDHRRAGSARRAGEAQSQRARGERTGFRADQRRADVRERSPSDGQSRRPSRGISARRQPAADQRRPVPQGDRGLQQRRAGPAGRHRDRGRRAAKPPHGRLVRHAAGRGSVGLQGARGQHARRRRQDQGDDAAARKVDPAHGARRSRLRPLPVDSRLRLGRRVHPRAGARARRHGDLPFPAQVLGDRDSEHHFAGRDRRDIRGDVSARLQHRQSVAHGAHDRHRVPCRRCDRDDREHRPPYRSGEAAPPSRPRRRGRDRLHHPLHHAVACGGVYSGRLHGGRGRAAFPRIRDR